MNGMPTAEQAVRLLRSHFFNREDLVAVKAPWGKPVPVEIRPETIITTGGADPLAALILSHALGPDAPPVQIKYSARPGNAQLLEGPHRIGCYAPGVDNTTRWICLDFDGAGHADALADPAGVAVATLERLRGAGIAAYLERSGGASGYHVWIFFERPEPADRARALGHHFAPRDAQLAGNDGELADAAAGRGIEVFPKQGAHRGSRKTGNLVWCPWWHGATTSGNLFYERQPTGGSQ